MPKMSAQMRTLADDPMTMKRSNPSAKSGCHFLVPRQAEEPYCYCEEEEDLADRKCQLAKSHFLGVQRMQGPDDRIEDELEEAVRQESIVGVPRDRSEL